MPTRRRLLTAVVIATFAAAPIVAVAADSPEAFVASVFARVTAGDGSNGGSEITDRSARGRWFTRSVVDVWNKAEDRAEKDGDIGPIDFDLLTDSQDPEVRRVSIEPRGGQPDRAVVRVGLFASRKVKQGERPHSVIDVVVVREDGAWRIDDLKQVSSSDPWSLRGLLSLP